MWKAMMFSVRPVRTASAALRTKRDSQRQDRNNRNECCWLSFRDSGPRVE